MTLLLLFFLLVHGDTFLRRGVEILPRFGDKRQAVEISQKIESDISAYLITITIMNAAVGVATAIVTWFTSLGDPIVVGSVATMYSWLKRFCAARNTSMLWPSARVMVSSVVAYDGRPG